MQLVHKISFLILLIVLITTYVLADTPNIYLDFEECEGFFANDSGLINTENGTWKLFNNSATSISPIWNQTYKKYGSCSVKFNASNDGVYVGDFFNATNSYEFSGNPGTFLSGTWEMWIYPLSCQDNAFIVSREIPGIRDFFHIMLNSSCNIEGHIGRGDSYSRTSTSNKAPVGEWTHIAMTWNGSKIQMWVNGEGDTMATQEEPFNYEGARAVMFGKQVTGTGTQYKFNGLIDEVKVWNYTRNIIQINEDMLSESTTCQIADQWIIDLSENCKFENIQWTNSTLDINITGTGSVEFNNCTITTNAVNKGGITGSAHIMKWNGTRFYK